MKKLITFLLLLSFVVANAAVPQKISYQAVIRNASGTLIVNNNVGMRISLLQGSATGSSVYVETQTKQTNANGLVSVEIGAGTVVSGVFANIDWSNQYYIKIETDVTGGTNYTLTATTQLLSVPYAIRAKSVDTETDPVYLASEAKKITNAGSGLVITTAERAKLNAIDGSETKIISTPSGISVEGSGTAIDPYKMNPTPHFIGENYGGGIVFFVYDNGQHGLIVSPDEWTCPWSNNTNLLIGSSATGTNAGHGNTLLIIADQKAPIGTPYAAWQCYNYVGGRDRLTDWYLPSQDELVLLYNASSTIGGFAPVAYWSSTESRTSQFYATTISFASGIANPTTIKTSMAYVRAIRKF